MGTNRNDRIRTMRDGVVIAGAETPAALRGDAGRRTPYVQRINGAGPRGSGAALEADAKSWSSGRRMRVVRSEDDAFIAAARLVTDRNEREARDAIMKIVLDVVSAKTEAGYEERRRLQAAGNRISQTQPNHQERAVQAYLRDLHQLPDGHRARNAISTRLFTDVFVPLEAVTPQGTAPTEPSSQTVFQEVASSPARDMTAVDKGAITAVDTADEPHGPAPVLETGEELDDAALGLTF